MARFKNRDLYILQDEELLFGDAQEASLLFDGSDLIINQVLKHDVDGYYATQEYVSSVLAGLEWQDSVLSMTTGVPVSPSAGDRYIVPSGAGGIWVGLDDYIAEWDGSEWDYTVTRTGMSAWVEDEGAYFVYNGSIWARMGTVVDHGLLDGLADDDHTQYVLVDGTRDMTGTLTIDQGAADDEILAFKSSDVTHGLISVAETDAYGLFQKYWASDGGLQITGIQDDVALAVATHIRSYGGTAITTLGSGGAGLVTIDVYEHDGANALTNITAAGVIFGVRAYTAGSIRAKYLLNEDGQSWQPGNFYVGITSNANMTQGITISQGGEDDEILALKSTDVTHAYVTDTETSTYGLFKKTTASYGGLSMQSFAEDHASALVNLQFRVVGGQANTTKGTGARGLVEYYITETDGAGNLNNITADGTIFAIRARVGAATKTRWFLDEDGDTYQSGDIMPFDASTQDIGSSSFPFSTIYSDTVSAGIFYGDGSGIIGTDHGDLTGLDDDDHPIYLPSDGSRAMTGTLTINTTGGYMRFSGLTADIGLASDIDMINLSSVGVTIDNNLTVTGSLSADHDTLLGLLDDDHTIYLNTTRHDTTTRHGAASVDHGLIDGLDDDDHTQYFLIDGSRDMGGDILPSASDTYDIGHSDAVWDNIWCKTLHASAGSVIVGTATLTDVGGVLTSDSEFKAPSGSDTDSFATRDYVTEQAGGGHTQGTDTTLGTMTADIDMDGSFQIIGLQAPDTAGEALRQTVNITEADLEQLTDGSDTTLHDHDGISENTGARHAESHTITSHSDVVDATGAQLETLTGGGDTTLHSHAGGTGTVQAWACWDNNGTYSLKDNFNVSSSTDTGPGVCYIYWGTDFANTSYAMGGMCEWRTAVATIDLDIDVGTKAVGSCRFYQTYHTVAVVDSDNVSVIAFGDQ